MASQNVEIRKDLRKARAQAVLELLRKAGRRPEELGPRLAQAQSPVYWRELNLQLSVLGESVEDTEPVALTGDEELANKFDKEGYLQISHALPQAVAAQMAASVKTLKEHGWPLVFGFVYDEFWRATRILFLARLLSTILGPAYKQIPKIWTHYVEPEGGAGWPPHTDGAGNPNRVTVWVALSDATLENGCMHLIPRDAAPARIGRNFPKLKTITQKTLRTLLMNTRALPVSAGGIVCWDHSVIHWGSKSSGMAEPRLAISLEFIAGSEKPKSDEVPLLDAHALPTFSQRLEAIGKALLAYQKFEPLVIRYAELAKEIVKSNAESA
jgi:Phytanoyl-CoA dioxygenase (PhyH)